MNAYNEALLATNVKLVNLELAQATGITNPTRWLPGIRLATANIMKRPYSRRWHRDFDKAVAYIKRTEPLVYGSY